MSTATPQPIPTICDKCRATGFAGDEAFAAIPDILNFTPVQRRAHVNGWTEEHQRAFIAALAITGSPRQAARAIGRHAFGAEQLRNHRAGKSFAAAWDAAIELARERETHRIHENLADLAKEREAELDSIKSRPGQAQQQAIHPDCDYDPEMHSPDYPEYWTARMNIRRKLLSCRRLYLAGVSDDPRKREAWEVLVGPTDWDRASRMEPQDDEPIVNPDAEYNRHGLPNFNKPDMVLTVGSGLLPELTGGHDALAELRAEFHAAAASPGEPEPAAPSVPGVTIDAGSNSFRAEGGRSFRLDEETNEMLKAMAKAREAHPEEDWN